MVGAGGGVKGVLAFTCRLICVCIFGFISSFPFLRLLCVITLCVTAAVIVSRLTV